MSMTQLKNNPSRNGFDLSSKRNFSAKVGELLPVWYKPVLAGDSFSIDLTSFTRTMPINTAAFARMREYYDFYFVPFETLWNKAPEILTQMLNNSQHSTGLLQDDNLAYSGKMPFITSTTISKYLTDLLAADSLPFENNSGILFSKHTDASVKSAKLLEYLGYGHYCDYTKLKFQEATNIGTTQSVDKTSQCFIPQIENLKLNPFPLMAYQKIYNDFYRYQQWEIAQPWTFNCDYIKGTDDLEIIPTLNTTNFGKFIRSSNIFTLRYSNYQRDLFRGLLPRAQYGDEASIDAVNSKLSFSPLLLSTSHSVGASSPLAIEEERTVPGTSVKGYSIAALDTSNPSSPITTVNGIYVNTITSFPILALRQAEFLQKWKEIAQSADEDYKSQIEAHWGVKVPATLSGMSRYLGGFDASLDINEVVNTNLADGNSADLAGKGYVSNGGAIKFESNGEFGIIMCIYHAEPLLDYITSGVDPYLTCVDSTSYPVPEFDKIGMELVDTTPLVQQKNGWFNSITKPFSLGYAPRYIYWKTDFDKSFGAFRSSLLNWILPVTDNNIGDQLQSSVYTDTNSHPNVPNEVSQAECSYGFFKVNPSIMDSLFAVNANASPDTDQLLCSTFFDVKVARNLDTNGLPY